MSDKDLIADARAAVDYSDDTGWFWVGRLADALEAATSERDAATEQAKEELAACLELRAYWRSKAIEARAERDAALAQRNEWAARMMEFVAALEVLERIREAVSGHPECDRYEEGDVISCGWKSAYASVVAALDGAPEPEVKP